MTTLAKVADLVAGHSVFNANGSLFAKIVGPFYAVYSYGEHFPVAIRQRTNDDPWLVNEDKFSRTTSKHQGYVRQGIERSGRGHIKCSTQNLKNLLNGGV